MPIRNYTQEISGARGGSSITSIRLGILNSHVARLSAMLPGALVLVVMKIVRQTISLRIAASSSKLVVEGVGIAPLLVKLMGHL
ncbi:uncharacterized protein EAE97_006693 [Botrytis byssoidea]|uniref:Uncharacterized protein n=1 Tax=Botrytis byssoidea TaxID=139641 RepID=A0A9P5IN11_9HELO|nr:uncharacterized protein EAE97_006693 [Botrytis byssoidea]KAF7941856.1 hypothetical protein EAE97_006693 [Botrytis byssoidea]